MNINNKVWDNIANWTPEKKGGKETKNERIIGIKINDLFKFNRIFLA